MFFHILQQMLFFFLHVTESGSFRKPLNREEEQECFQNMAAGDTAAREKLILHNMRLVAHITKKYGMPQPEQEELISIGTIGLVKAVDSFDYAKGARFATYASRCIENEILMYFRSQRNIKGMCPCQTPLIRTERGMRSRSWMSSASMTICWKPWIPGIPALRYANAWSTV